MQFNAPCNAFLIFFLQLETKKAMRRKQIAAKDIGQKVKQKLEPKKIGEVIGAWRRLVAHLHGVQGVGGSNPLAPTNFFLWLFAFLIKGWSGANENAAAPGFVLQSEDDGGGVWAGGLAGGAEMFPDSGGGARAINGGAARVCAAAD